MKKKEEKLFMLTITTPLKGNGEKVKFFRSLARAKRGAARHIASSPFMIPELKWESGKFKKTREYQASKDIYILHIINIIPLIED